MVLLRVDPMNRRLAWSARRAFDTAGDDSWRGKRPRTESVDVEVSAAMSGSASSLRYHALRDGRVEEGVLRSRRIGRTAQVASDDAATGPSKAVWSNTGRIRLSSRSPMNPDAAQFTGAFEPGASVARREGSTVGREPGWRGEVPEAAVSVIRIPLIGSNITMT